MLQYTTAQNDQDLAGILALQRANLAVNLTSEEVTDQGFVTVVHSPEDLRKMNDIEQHVIAKDGDQVVAYLLAMTPASRADIPVLMPMFDTFDAVQYHGRPIAAFQYIVVGQVCVDKAFRGQGVLADAYAEYKHQFAMRYDFAITEIATRNTRSIRAHEKIGFNEVHRFTAPDAEEWSIVVWEW
jgi:hypothetical protein